MANNDPLFDLAKGIPFATIEEGQPFFGRVGNKPVYVLRTNSSIKAFDATCSHLGGPLRLGLIAGSAIVCPWHHACFELGTGKALSAPAFNPLQPYRVQVRDEVVTVSELPPARPPKTSLAPAQSADGRRLAIVGGGAAGFAAAHTLRARGWTGKISMYSADVDPPYDRTLLTKDYLDGHFGDDRLEIAQGALAKLDVDLELRADVEAIDTDEKLIRLNGGRYESYHKLLLATGSTPKLLDIPGGTAPNVYTLRTLADCRRVLDAASQSRRVVIVGGSFIGLEAAASLTSRGMSVQVITPDTHPMEKLFGRALSDLIRETLASKGVEFHVGRKPAAIDGNTLTLDNGERLLTDFVLVGIGVTPALELARSASIAVDGGVIVDEFLTTSSPDVYAAGDIVSWLDRLSGERIRVEHWVVAQRQGQAAAANMLGFGEPLRLVPFFWSKIFDLSLRYVGHAQHWDKVTIEGDLQKRDALLRYSRNGRDLAVATLGRDEGSLIAEQAFYARLQRELRTEFGKP